MIYSLSDLLNPFGKGVAAFNKTLIVRSFEQRYFAIKDRIQFGLCTKGDSYLVHYRIPSESPLCKDVLYDVVLEFIPLDAGVKNQPTLDNYDVRVYTNSPSFTFTFTYAFAKYGLLIPWLRNKCIAECLKTPALEKNPQNIIGTDKSVWFAAYHFQRTSMKYKTRFSQYINTTKEKLEEVVLTQEKMLIKRARSEKIAREHQRQSKANDKASQRFSDYRAEKDAVKAASIYNATKPAQKQVPVQSVRQAAKDARSARSPVRSVSARSARSARSAKKKR